MKDTVINWVSVEEELPENDVDVLVFYKDQSVEVDVFNRGSGWQNADKENPALFWSYYNMPK